jgi:hypothetical protein
MKLRRSMGGRKVMAFLLMVPFLRADDPSVFNEIQATYDRTIRGQLTAKTPEDLDANERLIDTPDWVSIVNDGSPRRWVDLRGGLIATLGHPEDVTIKILKLTVTGDRAVVIARVGAPKDVSGDGDRSRTALIRDTWVRTSVGWRRKMHEKPAPGKLDADLK